MRNQFTLGFALGTYLAASAYNFDFYASMGNAFYRPHKAFYDKIQIANTNNKSIRSIDFIDYTKDIAGSLMFFVISLPPIFMQEIRMRQESVRMKDVADKAEKLANKIDPKREFSFEEFQKRVIESVEKEKK